jgi:hypothetical protein
MRRISLKISLGWATSIQWGHYESGKTNTIVVASEDNSMKLFDPSTMSIQHLSDFTKSYACKNMVIRIATS